MPFNFNGVEVYNLALTTLCRIYGFKDENLPISQ